MPIEGTTLSDARKALMITLAAMRLVFAIPALVILLIEGFALARSRPLRDFLAQTFQIGIEAVAGVAAEALGGLVYQYRTTNERHPRSPRVKRPPPPFWADPKTRAYILALTGGLVLAALLGVACLLMGLLVPSNSRTDALFGVLMNSFSAYLGGFGGLSLSVVAPQRSPSFFIVG